MEFELTRLIDLLPEPVWITTADGLCEFVNRQWRDYAGLPLDDVQALGWQAVVHPDDRPDVQAGWKAILATGAGGELEARLRRLDGAYRRFNVRISPIDDGSEPPAGWCAIAVDIDERRHAEALLAGEKLILEKVAQGHPLPAVLDALSELVEDLFPGCFCSVLLVDAGAGKFLVGSGPSLPDSYNAILHGKTIDPGYGPCSLAVALKSAIITSDLANDPRWAHSIWPPLMREYGLSSCWSMPIMSRAGEVCGVFAIYRRDPVSPTADERELIDRFTKIAGIAIERARADEALLASEAELRRAHGHLTEGQRLAQTGSFTWDVLRDETTWSDEMYRIFGLERGAKVTFDAVRAIFHPDDLQRITAGVEGIAQRTEFDFTCRLITAGGGLKHIHAVGRRNEEITDRPVFVGAFQDVTAQKLAEEALDRARTELSHVSRVTTLSALTASIAHEVNQPLAGIITNASTCLRMLAVDPPNIEGARATAQRTIRDGNRASDVIQRLRGLFTRKAPAIETVDLNDAIREVLALCSGELRSGRVIVRADLAGDLPPVSGDRVQLQQVILNLILNAADAMGEVSDRPRDLVVTTAREAVNNVRLSVRDSGVGLDPEVSEKLFDAFYTTKAHGMGVGLSISRSIIESHDGRIWAAANDGPGATFAFSIPSGASPDAAQTLRKA